MSDWNPKRPLMPHDKDGNILHYPDHWRMKDGGGWVEWEAPFFAVMSLGGMTNGRSAKYLNLVAGDGREYPMFVSDLVKGIRDQTITVNEGHLVGYWTGSKRGSNYGVRTVKI